MIQLLTTKDNKVFAFGKIELVNEEIKKSESEIKIITRGYKVIVDKDNSYVINEPYYYNLYELESIPDFVTPWNYSYTEEDGFYEDELIPIERMKSENEILKEQITEQAQTIAQQDELIAMLLLGE